MLTSLTGDDKTAQEGFIHDSGIFPGSTSPYSKIRAALKMLDTTKPSCDGTDVISMLTRERNAPVHRTKDGAARLSDKPSTSVNALLLLKPFRLNSTMNLLMQRPANERRCLNTAVIPFESDARLPVEFPEAKAESTAPTPSLSPVHIARYASMKC